jgi:transposase
MITADREQMYLMPPSVQEWLPDGDLAWMVLEAVEQMDLSGFTAAPSAEGGRPSYDPGIMVALLLYGYCVGQRSSRMIERLCWRDVGFRVVSGNRQPDHATIARFRAEHEKALGGLFVEVLKLCRAAGLVRVGVVALDGTKIKGSAALAANRTHESLESEVKRMLAEAKAVDEEEDLQHGKGRRGDELPEGLRRREDRLKRLRECKERLEAQALAEAEEQRRKIAERAAEEARLGSKLRGRKPGDPEERPDREAKANVTDPESRIMKTRSGYVQGYNAQAAVTEDQVVIAAEVTDEANDVKQLHPMMSAIRESLKSVGERERVGSLLADAGYWSESNARPGRGRPGTELLIATNKDWKQRKALRERPAPRGRIPEGLSLRDRMERTLLTMRGRALYRKRSKTVEPVFGQIKDARGCGRFMRRGMAACGSEWKLMCATHNLLKLWRSFRRGAGRLTRGVFPAGGFSADLAPA